MKKLVMLLPIAAAVAACDTREQSSLTGAAAGAALGAAASGDDNRAAGALVGAAAGAAAGSYIGRAEEPGQCVYENSAGQRYVADCPG